MHNKSTKKKRPHSSRYSESNHKNSPRNEVQGNQTGLVVPVADTPTTESKFKFYNVVCTNCGTDYEIGIPKNKKEDEFPVLVCAERLCLGIAMVEQSKKLTEQVLRPEK